MTDETLNAGSEEELPVNEEVVDEESASDETTDESSVDERPKGKEKALRDTEAALKERQAEFTRLSQEFSELKGQMSAMLALQQQVAQPKQEMKDWLDEMDNDKLVEDPASGMKQMIVSLRQELASVLADRDRHLMAKFGSISKIDPAVQATVDELRNDPVFADLPDDKLVAMAKKLSVPKKAVMQPRGSIAGSHAAAPTSTKKKDGYTPEVMAYLRAAGTLKSTKRDDTLE